MGALDLLLAAAVAVAPVPAHPSTFASAMMATRSAQHTAAARWDGKRPVPADLAAEALYEQRLVFALVDSERLRTRVLPRLGDQRPGVRDEVRAQIDLQELARGWPVKRHYTTGTALSPDALWRDYGRGFKRYRVSRSLLAAVNFVESNFNRLQSDSVAGAQGPMQFMPATWAAYGLGGNIHSPRDAILGAANYLHANGAPGDDGNALFHYNPSRLYVDAVSRYARRMRTPAGFRFYYARSLFVRAAHGRHRRIAGP